MALSIADISSEDPLIAFNFSLEISGQISGFFTEVSGLGSETEIVEHKVVSERGTEITKKIPGRLKWQDITLKRGITSSMDIWDWRKMVEDGLIEASRRDGSVVMYDQMGKEVARWNFERAWPSKVTGPSVKADDNSVGVEELTIVHEYIVRVK